MSRIRSSGVDVLDRLERRLARRPRTPWRTTASTGTGTLPGSASRIAFASPTRSGSASDLPILPPAARMNVLAMPPPTISASTFAASARRIVSLVDTFDPPTMATSGRCGCASARAERVELGGHQRAGARDRRVLRDAVRRRLGAMRGAERVVDVDVAQRRHLARERVVVLLLALVEAAVLEQHDVAGRERGVPRRRRRPSRGSSGTVAPEQLGQPLGDRRERILGAPARLRSAGRGATSPSPRAPRASASRMPGTDARMRVSSVMRRASSCGTLRSARMNTRLPRDVDVGEAEESAHERAPM